MHLTTLLELCGTTTGGNDVTDQKVKMHLILIVIELKNALVPLMTQVASCDTDANTSGIA